ncbi:AAA family ATPase [Nitrosospira sp. NpAV]|uniref:AAA family ATPase n=1 Tax=Nitrosospira sp. NpAV TaxID=58133 RepID=UPI0005A1D9D5|nr:ATP-binding protein [Nitrosospira sp. NpAV]KIO49625.1 chromosome partitioning protein ParA [Nitrosospira sp. NpAV]
MKKQFVKTSNYERFRTGITAVETRGAAEASLLLITGEAGYGKSATVDQWAISQGAAYLRAKVEWTPRYFMTELAESLKLDSRGRAKDIFARIAGFLGGQQIPLVIDEIEHCLRDNALVLEAIRDLSDLTEVLVVLVGMEQVQAKIARHAQISSRIAKVVTFLPATLEDVRLTCRQLADVEIAEDLVAEIHQQSGGRMREIMNAIATCERHASRNSANKIALADMAGQTLTHDWQARRPRLIKAGAR